jgi:signal peptidase I
MTLLAALALAAAALAGVGCGGGSHAAVPAAADVNGGSASALSTSTTTASISSTAGQPAVVQKQSKSGGGDAAGNTADQQGHDKSAPGSGTSAVDKSSSTISPSSHSDTSSGSARVHAGSKPKSKIKSASGAGTSTTTGSGANRSPTSGSSGSGGSSASGNAPNANTGVPYEVNTSSMEPTFQPETTVYYDPTRTTPQVGDVVIFYPPAGAKEGECGDDMTNGQACAQPIPGLTHELAMKRVVGLPGDTIAIRGGRVIRNGQPESEPPITPCGEQEMVGCEFPNPITVPAGHYYVMSDYRGLYQEDSRIFGAIPQEAIIGTVEQP